MQEILALFVAFGEAMRFKSRAKFGGMQVVKCANVRVAVGTYDDFQFCRELAKKSVKGVEELEVCFIVACLCAWMVDGGKGEGKLLVALFPLHLFSNTIIARQRSIDADKSPRKFAVCVGCDWWLSSRGFPALIVAR
jgi:hypothetical protein